MDPYIVTEMVRQRQCELLGEAARERLAASTRAAGASSSPLASLAARLSGLRLRAKLGRIQRSGLGPAR